MKVFRDLLIRGDTERLITTMGEVERHLCDGWTRGTEAERNLRDMALRGEPTYCFACEHPPAAVVFVTQKEPGLFYVPNVIPRDQRELSHDEYNGILAEFCQRFVRPAAGQPPAFLGTVVREQQVDEDELAQVAESLGWLRVSAEDWDDDETAER